MSCFGYGVPLRLGGSGEGCKLLRSDAEVDVASESLRLVLEEGFHGGGGDAGIIVEPSGDLTWWTAALDAAGWRSVCSQSGVLCLDLTLGSGLLECKPADQVTGILG
jgi:hypothetical protein